MKVIPGIDIPLDLVPITLRCKGPEPVASGNPAALFIRSLLVFLIMTVIGVDYIAELANLILHVKSLDLGVFQVCLLELVTDATEEMLVLSRAAACLGVRHSDELCC